MATINTTKNAVELRKVMGTKLEHIVINGQTIGIMGSVSEADREAALKALNEAYIASNGDIFEMMTKLNTIATLDEKNIEADEVIDDEIIISYKERKAYDMDGNELANCEGLPNMPKEAVKALLMERVKNNF